MPRLQWYLKSKSNWTPTSYSADQSAVNLFSVADGDLVGPLFVRVRTAFDGTGGRTISIGDGDDNDRFMTTTTGDISAAGILVAVGGSASTYLAIGRHLYTAADTIDMWFTAATGGSPTAGALDIWYWVAKAYPT